MESMIPMLPRNFVQTPGDYEISIEGKDFQPITFHTLPTQTELYSYITQCMGQVPNLPNYLLH